MSDEQRPGPPDRDAEHPAPDWKLAETGRFDPVTDREPPASAPDATAPLDQVKDQTRAMPPVGDQTRAMPPTGDQTRAMPAADEATPEPTPAWSGRAQVQAPRPAAADDAGAGGWPPAGPLDDGRGGKWWMPILIGVVALLLLGGLAYGVWRLTRSSGPDAPAPAASSAPPASVAPSVTPSSPPPTSGRPSTTPPEQAQKVPVPPVVGRQVGDAVQALDDAGLTYRLTYTTSRDVPAGTVISTDPGAGKPVTPGSEVRLVIAQAPSPTATPSPTSTVDVQQPED